MRNTISLVVVAIVASTPLANAGDGTTLLRIVRVTDSPTGPIAVENETGFENISLGSAFSGVFYLQARLEDNLTNENTHGFAAVLSDGGAGGTIFGELLALGERFGLPELQGPSEFAGMFPPYRTAVGDDNRASANGGDAAVDGGSELDILALDLSPGCNCDVPIWWTVYKLRYTHPGLSTAAVITADADEALVWCDGQSTPIPVSTDGTFLIDVLPCPCDANADNTVGVEDLLDFLARWFAGDSSADFDDNGDVAIEDLLGFVSCWFVVSSGGICE